jgi:uncharacterized membrane protein
MRVPDRVLLAALLTLAALLRFGALEREEIWLDEAQSVTNVTESGESLFQALAQDNKPPLYYIVLEIWTTFFGTSLSAIRSLSALCGVIAVAVVWRLGFPLVSPGVARTAAVLLTLHPLAVHYAREARNYSLLILLTLTAILALARAIDSNRRHWWIVYAATLSAAIMTHYLGLLLVPVSAIQVTLLKKKASPRAWLVSTILALVPLVAWLPWASQQQALASSSLAWFRPFWESWGPLEPFARSLVMFSPGGAAPPWVGMPASAALQPFVILTGLAALASFAFPRKPVERDWTGRAVICAAIAVPLLLLWLASVVAFPVYLVGRADLVALPGVVLFFATGIVTARNLPVAMTVGGLVAVTTLFGLFTSFAKTPSDVERPILEPLALELRTGDLVVCTGLTRPTAEYYIRRSGAGVMVASYPEEMSSHGAFFDPGGWTLEVLEADAEAVDDRIRNALRGKGRAVVLLVDHESTGPLRRRLAAHYRLDRRTQYRLRREGSRVSVVEVSRRQLR